MNILFVNYNHTSKRRGGIERVTNTLYERLTKRGHNIYMLSVNPPMDNDKLEEYQFLLPVNGDSTVFLRQFLQSKKIEIIVNQSERPDIAELINQAHEMVPIISCIHTHPYAGIKGCQDTYDHWKVKYGILFTLLRPIFEYKLYRIKKRSKKYIRETFKRQYKQSDAIVLLSKKYISTYSELISTIDSNKVFAIPNPLPYQTKTTQIKKGKIIIFVGRIEHQKRIDRLLLIWKRISVRHPDWKLQIIGEGSNINILKTLSIKLKLSNIKFFGNREPEKFYQKASIICITSSHEGLPMVLLEATQNNVIPVVFNSFESASDIIKDKYSGFLIRPFSIKDFSNTLDALMRDDKYRKIIMGNIEKEIEHSNFSPDTVVDCWEELFIKLNHDKQTTP